MKDSSISLKHIPLVINNSSDLKLSATSKDKLSLLMNLVRNGSSDIQMTPLGKSHGPEFILDRFNKIFNLELNLRPLNKVLLDIEMSQKAKYGPRSISLPWSDRKASVRDYFKDSTLNVSGINSDPPISRDLYKLRPISLTEAKRLLKRSTSSGLPFIRRKGELIDKIDLSFLEKFANFPCILFTRTQEMFKTRNVWGFPIVDTLLEMMFYKPLLEYQKKLPWRSALIGPDAVDTSLTELINQSLINNKFLLSIDFSAYDASVGTDLQSLAFTYIAKLFQPAFFNNILNLAIRFNTIGLVTPDGIYEGSHGVPSGSTFTNEVDSIVQFLIARHSKVVFQELLQIQGDDGVYSVITDNVDTLFKSFTDYGLNVNKDKSVISQNYCTYLQKLYHVEYRNKETGIIHGIYPVYRALLRLVYQERFVNFEEYGILGKDYYSIRAITILENCKHHPYFEVLVRFVYDLDKYKLDVSQDGLNKYVDMLVKTSGSEGILINQYGDDVRGLKNFECVKLISQFSK